MERTYTTEELHVMEDLQHDVQQLKKDIENWRSVLRTEYILLNKEEMKKLAAQTVAASMTIIQNKYPIEMYVGVYEIYREELTEIFNNYIKKLRRYKQMNEAMKLENEKMMEKCYAFMQELKDILGGAYTFGKSPIVESTCHLIPKGTEELNTYYSKPPKSFRCSDHWNWYANLKKCSNPNYVQCYNVDAFWPYKRTGAGATKHIWQCCVGYFADDNRFHVVYGQKFDRKTRETTWVESTPIEVLKEWLYDDPSDLGKYVAERINILEKGGTQE